MDEAIYLLTALVSIGCAAMLVRGYRKSRTKLLLWVCWCFVGLAFNAIFLFYDVALTPEVNLNGAFWRNLIGTVSGSTLLYGLIWELT